MLWLDDIRTPPGNGWTWVKNHAEFTGYIMSYEPPRLASFDHDLADGSFDWQSEPTGYDCVKLMIERRWFPREVILHSMNLVGVDNMRKALLAVGYRSAGTAQVPRATQNAPVLCKR